jgi:serine/threonine protein kinase
VTTALRVQPRSSSGTDSIQAELIEQFLERLQAGEELDPSEFAAQHPDHAEALRQLLPALQLMGELSRSSPRGRPILRLPEAISSPELGVVGDFRILREVGRGGMGVVYEAEQLSLHRRVALKVLPLAGGLDTRQLQRFKTEAQAAALLHHTNIVPIHAVGCERGVHYYAMQFIDGQTLAQVINEQRSIEPQARGESAVFDSPNSAPAARSSTPNPSSRTRELIRTAVKLGIQAAEAVEHAHSFGVIHRDIKPANLLIDERGNLWITDFGLARLQNECGLTMSGDLIGTLRYMSPEQAMGRAVAVDHRTDIYSLGVTLYELMTLKPAIKGQNRQEMLRQIAHEEPVPPRQLAPALARELETILLKAMNKEPMSRYRTALELANDLRCFLEHKPIQARRPSLVERVAKWSRRHRAIVAAAFCFLLFAIVTLAASTLLIARQRRDAEIQRDEARTAVNEMYTEVAEKWLDQQAALEPLQERFLQKALNYYRRSAGETSADPNLRLQTAIAYRRVGAIQAKLGRSAEAQAASRRAIEVLEALVAQQRSVPHYRYELAICEATLGHLFWASGPQDAAAPALRRAVALLERLHADAPGESLYRYELARTQSSLGRTLREADYPTSVAALEHAVAHLERLVGESPHAVEYRRELATSYGNLGLLLADFHRPTEQSQAMTRRAIELCEQLVADVPSAPEYRNLLAANLGQLARWVNGGGGSPEMEALFRRAVELEETVAAASPSVPRYRRRLAMDTNNLGSCLVLLGRHVQAEHYFRRAISLFEKLVADTPSSEADRRFLSITHGDLGQLLAEIDRAAEAEREFREAIALEKGLLSGSPDAEHYQRQLGDHKCKLADLFERTERILEAEQERKQVIAMLQKATDAVSQDMLAWVLVTVADPRLRNPRLAIEISERNVAYAPGTPKYRQTVGVAHYRAGDGQAAIRALDRVVELRNDGGDPTIWFFLALAHMQQGDKAKAVSYYEKAERWMNSHNPRDLELRRFQDETAAMLGVSTEPNSTAKQEHNPR